MNKKSKDLKFLIDRGIFDNKRIYENTISAFERAIKLNYIIELDVRMLSCGTIIVFHDDDMERLLHVEGSIDKLTYDELTYMAKYQIPTLKDVLNLVNGSVPLLIETKSKTKRYALEIKLNEYLKNYNGLYAIQSFNLKSIKWFYKNNKDVPIGYLVGKRNYKNEPIFFRKYDFISVSVDLFSDKRVRKMREDKIVMGWGIKTKEQFELKKDVYDNLVCDNLLEIDAS